MPNPCVILFLGGSLSYEVILIPYLIFPKQLILHFIHRSLITLLNFRIRLKDAWLSASVKLLRIHSVASCLDFPVLGAVNAFHITTDPNFSFVVVFVFEHFRLRLAEASLRPWREDLRHRNSVLAGLCIMSGQYSLT